MDITRTGKQTKLTLNEFKSPSPEELHSRTQGDELRTITFLDKAWTTGSVSENHNAMNS